MGFGARDHLENLLRDLRLPRAVHREREAVDQLAGRLRGVAHRRHPCALLGRGRLEQRAVDLGLQVDGQEALEDLLGLGSKMKSPTSRSCSRSSSDVSSTSSEIGSTSETVTRWTSAETKWL